jgi:hypothetical protein
MGSLSLKPTRSSNSRKQQPIPTSVEIARTETAISWPARYLGDVPLHRTVGAIAHARARYREIAWAARKLGLPGRLARRWNDEGLELIAAGCSAAM